MSLAEPLANSQAPGPLAGSSPRANVCVKPLSLDLIMPYLDSSKQ